MSDEAAEPLVGIGITAFHSAHVLDVAPSSTR